MTTFHVILKCLLWVLLGSASITFAVDEYHNGDYFMFGWNMMFTIVFATSLVKVLLKV